VGSGIHSLCMAQTVSKNDVAEASLGPVLTPELVFASHFDFVWRSLRRLGVAPSALDDAVQEVFVVVCRRLHTLHGEPQLRPWLFSIATHVAHKARRTGQRRGAEPLPEVLLDQSSLSPQEAAAQAEAVRVVYALLEQLSPPQRTVFVLAHLEQFTAPEIAATLDLPLNTVYSRLRAGRAAMEAALCRHRARSGEMRLIGTESA
jgi:RNA polymerase sigma-70 factor, ECF subfamily